LRRYPAENPSWRNLTNSLSIYPFKSRSSNSLISGQLCFTSNLHRVVRDSMSSMRLIGTRSRGPRVRALSPTARNSARGETYAVYLAAAVECGDSVSRETDGFRHGGWGVQRIYYRVAEFRGSLRLRRRKSIGPDFALSEISSPSSPRHGILSRRYTLRPPCLSGLILAAGRYFFREERIRTSPVIISGGGGRGGVPVPYSRGNLSAIGLRGARARGSRHGDNYTGVLGMR